MPPTSATLTRPVVYACVTAGYDQVAPIPSGWGCDFILFHDGSVRVPSGWQGRSLQVEGLSGADLNRYAKMMPHRLALPSSDSMYADGNVIFKQDPSNLIRSALARGAMSAYPHPSRNCAYAEIRETLRLGFAGPRVAWAATKQLRRLGVPRQIGLFEAGVLIRHHEDATVIALGNTWWQLWQRSPRRDQALLMAAIWHNGMKVRAIGLNDLHDDSGDYLGIGQHAKARPRLSRMPNRLAAELALFRTWLPR
jgi:hypothetical protein